MTRITPVLRHVQPGDEPFLFHAYASTRLEELAMLCWSADEQAAFLTQHFNAQQQHYHEHYADADFQIVQLGDRPAGCCRLARRDPAH